MKKRLFLYTILTILISLTCFFAASVYVTHNNNIDMATDTVIETAQICAELYIGNADIFSAIKTNNDTRVTIISSDGAVLADNLPIDLSVNENRLNRPEIQAAASGSPMAYIRYSDTLGVDFIYYALKVEHGGSYVFIRAAVPVAKIDTYLFQSLPLLLFLFTVIIVSCLIFIRNMINRITKPFASIENKLRSLAGGEYISENTAGSYEEINAITQNIDDVALVLQNSVSDLRDEKNKLDYIIGNINDGIFAIDENKNVKLINATALDIFNVNPDIVGKNLNYLSFDKILVGALNECMNEGKDVLHELTLNGRIFFTAVKQLSDTNLTMMVLSDVTENRESAKRREEFFANASHELKTPLTAIKGLNELTAINNKDENIQKYIDSITRETNRMLTLIGDMLKLSELESTQEINPALVSLSKTAYEVRDVLSGAINEKAIVFDIDVVGDGMVIAEQGHIFELVKNLVENAVRYNNEGGKVSVTVESDKKATKFVVSDNGIGIPPDEQTRIFERFYRVEKSRSVRNGGTGLGLSIVKHICALYGWKLSLKSKYGVGTEVEVMFNL